MSSGLSRTLKYIRELAGTASLSEAGKLQSQPLWIVVGQEAGIRTLPIVRAVTAIAVRTCAGPIEVRIAGDDLFYARVRQTVEIEASDYGCQARVSVKKLEPAEQVANGLGIGIADRQLVSADASGMYAGINLLFKTDWPAPHASAACFAAAAAFAKYFAANVLNRPAAAAERWVFSLETLEVVDVNIISKPTSVEPAQLGEAHLLGGGAIGSAYSFVANMAADEGRLEIVDKDRYDEPNQETTFFLNRKAAMRRQPKAEALAGYAARAGLELKFQPQMEVIKDDPYLAKACNAFVCAVDNTLTRRLLDATDADVLLNAGLGGTALDGGHILVTWHTQNTGKLSSLYPESIEQAPDQGANPPSEITDKCSRIDYDSVSLAAPFIALAAGSMLYALCRQSALGLPPDANYFKIDLLGHQSSISRRLTRS
jgi:hypothetical protein